VTAPPLAPLSLLLAALAGGCHPSSPAPRSTTPPPPPPPPITQPAEATPARFAPATSPTAAHLRELEPLILEVAARADAGDVAYFSRHMGRAGDHLVQLMIERVRESDLRKTYRAHLIGDRLNYHDVTHVQVDFAMQEGRWGVSRIWFCR
jgi:hypothetical protein